MHDQYKFITEWVKRQENPYKKLINSKFNVRIVDLFCGCGGLTLGAVEAIRKWNGTPEIAFANDINTYSLKTYLDNFGDISKITTNNDIRTYFQFQKNGNLSKNDRNTKAEIGKVDILMAGPPCQGHSDLNNSTRRNDPRNELYLSVIQAIKILKPNFVIIENVPTVVHSKENVVTITKNILNDLGYECGEEIIQFVKLGLAQTRKRHVLLASRKSGIIANLQFQFEISNQPILSDFIKDIESQANKNGVMSRSGKLSIENKKRIDYLFSNSLYNLPDKLRPDCHKMKKHSYISNYGRLHYDKPAQTITSGFGSIGQGRYIHPTQKRTITLREAARIQGFPDDFNFAIIDSITQIRQMIANAVPPQLSYFITDQYIRLNKNLFKVKVAQTSCL